MPSDRGAAAARRRAWRGPVPWLALALAVWPAILFAPVLGYGFLNYDDDAYVTDNPWIAGGWSGAAAVHALTTPHEGNYHPVTMLSHLVDVAWSGLDPSGHHLTNLLLHVANVLLLFVFLQRLTGRPWPSALVAAWFAVHPLNVQSVAWIAERKNVLSTTFWLLALLAYLSYVVRPAPARYLAVFAAAVLGLASKPMVVTLPLTLLIVDLAERRGWAAVARPHRRGWGVLILEKLPLFAASAACGFATLWAQRAVGAMQTLDGYSPLVRLGNALSGAVWYLERMVWPAGLAVFYPHPLGSLSPIRVALSAVALAVLSWLFLRKLGRVPWLAAGWSWYLATLLPVSGLVQVGAQAYADRYAYVPLVGAFVVVAFGGAAWSAGWRPGWRRAAAGAGLIAVATLSWRTAQELRHWRDSESLFRRAIEVTQGNTIALGNLGMALVAAGRVDEALTYFRAAVEIAPDRASGQLNLANALDLTGSHERAERHYREAIRLDPADPRPRYNLARGFERRGARAEAIRAYRALLDLDPAFHDAPLRLAGLLVRAGSTDDALAVLLRARRDVADEGMRVDIDRAIRTIRTNRRKRERNR